MTITYTATLRTSDNQTVRYSVDQADRLTYCEAVRLFRDQVLPALGMVAEVLEVKGQVSEAEELPFLELCDLSPWHPAF